MLKKGMSADSKNRFENIIYNHLNQMLRDPKYSFWNEIFNSPDEVLYALYKLYCVEHK